LGQYLLFWELAVLIYAAVLFVNGGADNTKALIIYGILGLLFFFAGISLVRTTKDES